MEKRMRNQPEHGPRAKAAAAAFHTETVEEVAAAVKKYNIVVVGMAWNPFVRRIRKELDEYDVRYKYLGYGSYLSGWKKRLAIKLWSGWPTYPQVFVRGRLVGGASEMSQVMVSGELHELLAEDAA